MTNRFPRYDRLEITTLFARIGDTDRWSYQVRIHDEVVLRGYADDLQAVFEAVASAARDIEVAEDLRAGGAA